MLRAIALGLKGYLAKRAVNTIVLIFFVLTLNYMIFVWMPGTQGSLAALAGNVQIDDPELKQKIVIEQETKFGLRCGTNPDGSRIPCPIWNQYAKYMTSMITFQFGTSFQTGKPIVYDMISTGRLTNTLILLGVSSVVSILLGILIGVITARRRGSLFDNGSVTAALTTYSLPTFWIGMMLILIFAFWLGWFPASGVQNPDWARPELRPDSFIEELPGRLQYLFLPVLTLTLFFYGGYLLLTRATMMETLSEDYVTTARAKGLPERTVLYKHALKNASLPLVTAAALQFGFLLSGAIITETVFSWDGLGSWLFQAIGWKDGPVLQAMFYIIALSVILANFAADIIYGLIDPRIKYE